MPRIVILGTGTGVGKTYVATSLVRALAAAAPELAFIGLKPIETGVRHTKAALPPPRSDAALLERASAGPPLRPHPLYAFPAAVSPHLAARRARVAISLARVERWIRRAEHSDTTLHAVSVVVETAGAVFSPLSHRLTNLDLAKRLEPAIWILVAPDALGVLHDVRATLIAMSSLARRPDYVVLSASRGADASVGTNARELRRLGLSQPIATIRRNASSTGALTPLVRALLR